MNTSVEKDIEFDQIRELLADNCYSESSCEAIYEQGFYFNREEIVRALAQVKEYTLLSDQGIQPAFGPFNPFGHLLRDLRPEGSVLELEQVVGLKNVLSIYEEILKVWKKDSEERSSLYPFLHQLSSQHPSLSHVLSAIDRVVDVDGTVRDDASEGLIAIRRKQRRLQGSISTAFSKALKKNSGFLIDSQESLRNGRRVLAVKAENKRQIDGLIHDESSTGKTVFIEPQEVIVLNHQVFELQLEEKKEIFKIIRDLCAILRQDLEAIGEAEKLVIEFDVIRAKAQLAVRMEAEMPEVLEGPHMEWLEARHPLLFLKNKELGKETVPSDFTLFGKNRILLISGPNAGGKSISLKTCALLQHMVQFGLLVPCNEQSKAGIFRSIMVDIGDQQSIENDLSTYSSRLKKMAQMLDTADGNTLICIDEFGSGTDPTTGGALAESMLKAFLLRGCYGIITTHYSNLKVFAFKNQGIVNAAMNFDEEALTPTYKLTIGKPGSSFAFEIAQKMKLPAAVIQGAKKRLGSKRVKVEDLLVAIQAEKNALEKELEGLKNKEAQLDKLIKTYSDLKGQLDYQRKKLKLQSRERKLSIESEYNRKLEQTIHELRKEKKLEKAQELAAEQRHKKVNLSEEVAQLQEEIFEEEKSTQDSISKNDFVRMRNGDVTGQVEDIQKGIASVLFGGLRIQVPLKDLTKVKEPIHQVKKGVYTDIQKKSNSFKTRIDIRGLKMEDAKQILQNYMDEAVVVGVSRLEIVHGKGNGILRKVVKEKAREYKEITEITHPKPEEGGDGISIVHLE